MCGWQKQVRLGGKQKSLEGWSLEKERSQGLLVATVRTLMTQIYSPSYTDSQDMLGPVENKLWLQEELSVSPPAAVVYNTQQRVAVSRSCLPGPTRAKADGSRTDGAKDMLDRGTIRPGGELLPLVQYEALSQRERHGGVDQTRAGRSATAVMVAS